MRQLEDLGVAPDRIIAEDRSRNTIENAVFSRRLADPKPGQRWLLVTSAYHMPRSVAAFRAAGFPVEPYPVDWRTRGLIDALRPFSSLGEGLRRTDTAVREWVGLVAYRLAGKTTELFPGRGGSGRCRKFTDLLRAAGTHVPGEGDRHVIARNASRARPRRG